MNGPETTLSSRAYNMNLDAPAFLQLISTPPPCALSGQSLLHDLAREGDVLSAEVLIAAGADIDAQDEQGRRPLHEAAFFNQVDMISLLAAHGALTDAPIHPFGHTALWMAVSRGHMAAARALIEKGARLCVADHLSGRSLLHAAAETGDMPMAGLLIRSGIDVFHEDRKGKTARDLAAQNGRRELEAALLKVMEHHARRGA